MTDGATLDTRLRDLAPALARIGLALVFLYFGLSQLRHPAAFFGWLPPEVSLLPLSASTFVVLNGAFETFFGALLLFGIYTRASALLLGLHLAGITLTIGWSQIGVRDFGLTLATLAVALHGVDKYGLDQRFKRASLGRLPQALGDAGNQDEEYRKQQRAP